MPSKHGLADHERDVYEWWMLSYGRSSPEDREWCRNIAYERWLNDRALLSADDPPTPWYAAQRREAVETTRSAEAS